MAWRRRSGRTQEGKSAGVSQQLQRHSGARGNGLPAGSRLRWLSATGSHVAVQRPGNSQVRRVRHDARRRRGPPADSQRAARSDRAVLVSAAKQVRNDRGGGVGDCGCSTRVDWTARRAGRHRRRSGQVRMPIQGVPSSRRVLVPQQTAADGQ